ncbi:hypothetical protein IWQ61_010017 [Dispira simplex]|nr:hypothetical protein IWQ61_010017 [Dispira simplex]
MFSIPAIPLLTGERLVVIRQSELDYLFQQQEILLAVAAMVLLLLIFQLVSKVLSSVLSLFWTLLPWPFRSSPKAPCSQHSESPSEMATVLQVLEKQHQSTLQVLTLLAQRNCAPLPKRIRRSPRVHRVAYRIPKVHYDSMTSSSSTAQESTPSSPTIADPPANDMVDAAEYETLLEENIAFCDGVIGNIQRELEKARALAAEEDGA